MLRPAPVSARAIEQWQAGMPEATFTLNSWQMRDRERSVAKPQGIALRSLFIGDSVLDGSFSRSSIPSRVEALLRTAGRGDVEAINLGVTSTGPVEYYYRLQRVGLELSADAVVMLLFAGMTSSIVGLATSLASRLSSMSCRCHPSLERLRRI